MRKNLLKTVVLVTVFGISYVGLTNTNSTKKIAGEEIHTNLVTLGSQAQAYCPEATYTFFNDGRCDGSANSWNSRCVTAKYSGMTLNCEKPR